jgi:hypothetical protein
MTYEHHAATTAHENGASMDAQPPITIEEAPVTEMQQLRAAFPDIDVNLELLGTRWVFTARGRDGADPWFLSSDDPTRFTSALLGKGFRG